jgi:lia operon protein LiaG
MNKTVKIVILSVIVAALVALVIVGVNVRHLAYFSHGRLMFGERQESQGAAQTQFDADTEGIQNIRLDFISEQIEVVVTNENKIRIEETSSSELSKDDMMVCSVKGNTVVAESGLKDEWMDFFDFMDYQDIKVTLYLPSAYQNDLTLSTVSGTINTQDVKAAKLSANTTSGTIDVDGAQSDKLDLDSISGAIMVTGGRFETVTANTVSGEVRAEAERINDFDADSTSGAVNISVNEMPARVKINTVSGSATVAIPENDGFTLKYDTVSGGVNSDFALAHDMYKDGGSNIDIGTVSGGINLIKK